MTKILQSLSILLLALPLFMSAQTNEWGTEYVTLDDPFNGTGYQTTSMAVVEANRFVALVTQTPGSPVLENLFDPPGNYLVGYWDADSVDGRVNSPINGQPDEPQYAGSNQFTDWTSGLDQVPLKGAYQMATNGDNGYVYVANNDDAFHNILVFQLTADGVVSTDFRMETGTVADDDFIYAIDVDDAGYVYVMDYEGSDSKTDEIKIYAGIGAEGTTWGDFSGHNDDPVATVDLPAGIHLGICVSGDGSQLFVSSKSARQLWKYSGSPVTGYSPADGFAYTMAADDTVSNGATPSLLGLGFLDATNMVFAAVDTFLSSGGSAGYTYARVYVFDGRNGTPLDTIDIAEWNLEHTGDYSSGSNNGLAGGFGSILDISVDQETHAIYTQTYYGWAVEKWVFDGDLSILLAIQQVSNAVPAGFTLKQNYPNPFNPVTTIAFDLLSPENVTLEIFNTLGQKVATLVNKRLATGSYEVQFDASYLSSGAYLYKIQAGSFQSAKKMMLIK